MEMKTYHAISRALEKEGLKDKKSPLNLSPELQDEIGTAFSLFKTDEDITGRLKRPCTARNLRSAVKTHQLRQVRPNFLESIAPNCASNGARQTLR